MASNIFGWIKQNKADLACIVIIILIATAFLAPALLPGKALLPLQNVSQFLPWSTVIKEPIKNRTLGDPFFAFYPRRWFFTEMVQKGELPLWNPNILGGYPAVGDTNAQTFYPPNWLAATLFSPARSFAVLALFHLVITGVFMFLMLRSFKLQPGSSLFGAISWMLSGILIVWLEHPHRLSTFAWMPALFWLFHLGIQRRKIVYPVLAGLMLAMMTLGGQPQYVELAGLLLAAYALAVAVQKNGTRFRWTWWPVISLLVVTIIGLGIGTLQLLPAAEFLAQSHREPRQMEIWLRQAYPLRELATLWMPDLFGSSQVGKYPYWGQSMNDVEYTFYYGVIPFLLSLVAPLLARQKRVALLWSAALILTVAVAVGSPLVQLARWLPGMVLFSLHRMMSHVPFLGSWLAALTLDALIARPKDGRYQRWIAAGIAGILVATGLVLYATRMEIRLHWAGVAPELWRLGWILALGLVGLWLVRWRPMVGLLMILVVATVDQFEWGRDFNPVADLTLLYPENEVTTWLEKDTSLYRVIPLAEGQAIFGPNVLSLFNISTPDGYLAMTLEHHKELMYTISPYYEEEWRRLRGPHINSIVVKEFHPLHSLLNVRYLLSSLPLDVLQLHFAARLQDVYIYENRGVLPRAYVVHRAQVVREDQVLDTLVTGGWDMDTEVVLSQPLDPEKQTALNAAPIQDESSVRIDRYEPNQILLTAQMEHPGILVLTDPFCVGWRATVDGHPVEIIRTNHALRSLFLDAGEHTVTFTFWPDSLTTAIIVATLTIILGVVLVLLGEKWSEHPALHPHRQG